MTAPFRSRTITEVSELASLEPEWWELWQKSLTATPFQSPAWLLSWCKHFAAGNAFVLAIEFDRRLVGIAPFYCEQDQQGQCLRLMGFPVSDYHDFLIDPTFEEPTLAVLRTHLTDAGFWDVIELTELPPAAYALRMTAPVGCNESTTFASACPILSLPNTHEELARVFPARKRRALRMSRNRAARRGRMRISTPDGNTVLDTFETLVALHRHRWGSRGEPGVLADSRVQQFHRDALPALMNAGLLRFYLLQIDDRPVAAYYGLRHRHDAYGYLTGFEPAYAFESPGVILLEHAIAEATREGLHTFHFLRGREAYKYGWGAHDCWNKQRVCRRSPISSTHELTRQH
jgi:CelD/BcsL family acetyltransferase involved in cellulose biosynthesis